MCKDTLTGPIAHNTTDTISFEKRVFAALGSVLYIWGPRQLYIRKHKVFVSKMTEFLTLKVELLLKYMTCIMWEIPLEKSTVFLNLKPPTVNYFYEVLEMGIHIQFQACLNAENVFRKLKY